MRNAKHRGSPLQNTRGPVSGAWASQGKNAHSEADRVYTILKNEILSKRLAASAPLRQVEIAQRLKTSRTPAREAIFKLAADRLVDLSGRSARVANLSLRDFLEVNQLRWLLEGFAARVAADRIPEAEILRLDQALAEFKATDTDDDPRQLESVDQLVHMSIAAHSNNERLRLYIQELSGMMAIARIGDIDRRHGEMIKSLEDILAALRARDGNACERLMQDHIRDFTVQLPMLLNERRR
jgi:DNA-binding GntR family transcriptional regulator